MLHEHGMSISYDRVREISAQLGQATVNKYVEDGVACPPELRKQLFTTHIIDRNLSATTASTSFQGTSVSVFQHPTKANSGEERQGLRFGPEKVKSVQELPDSFTDIHPSFFKTKKPLPPNTPMPKPAEDELRPQPHLSMRLEKVIIMEEINCTVSLSWSAHHASCKRSMEIEVSITSPLRDQAHCVDTVRHVMEKVQDIVAYLNPGQVPSQLTSQYMLLQSMCSGTGQSNMEKTSILSCLVVSLLKWQHSSPLAIFYKVVRGQEP